MYDQFAAYYDVIFTFKQPTHRFLSSWLTKSKANILDLGCGTGSYLKVLNDEGHRVVGVDNNPAMLQIAREKCPQGVWLNLNLNQLSKLPELLPANFEPDFDLIFCAGNVLSYLKADQIQYLVQMVSQFLNVGGYWVFQVVNWERILQQKEMKFPVLENKEQNIQFFRCYQNISDRGAFFETELKKNGQTVFKDRQQLFAYKRTDFVRLHQQATLIHVGFFGDFQKSPFKANQSGALIGVYQKV